MMNEDIEKMIEDGRIILDFENMRNDKVVVISQNDITGLIELMKHREPSYHCITLDSLAAPKLPTLDLLKLEIPKLKMPEEPVRKKFVWATNYRNDDEITKWVHDIFYGVNSLPVKRKY